MSSYLKERPSREGDCAHISRLVHIQEELWRKVFPDPLGGSTLAVGSSEEEGHEE